MMIATVAADPTQASSARPSSLVWLVTGLFFTWGGATSLNDILIPKLRGLFSLSYAEGMLTQFAFFAAYLIISAPAGLLVAKIGYVRGLVAGLCVMALGALLFWPASWSGAYWPFLAALFVLAAGITVLQVASNPLITTLGDAKGASSRLTFAQAFNSLGTTIWPYVGAQLILGSTLKNGAVSVARSGETAVVSHIYISIAIVLAIVAMIFWSQRNVLAMEKPERIGLFDSLALLKQPRVAFGCAALFVYVGAEVSIGSILVNYLEQPTTLALGAQTAGERLSFYWGGAMVGRFIGSWLLNRVVPGVLLAGVALVAAALVLVSMSSTGNIAGWSLLAVGLFNSIMFPTIFSLSMEGQGTKSPEAAGLLCMAIVGGAIVPVICYGVIGAFGLFARKPINAEDEVVVIMG